MTFGEILVFMIFVLAVVSAGVWLILRAHTRRAQQSIVPSVDGNPRL